GLDPFGGIFGEIRRVHWAVVAFFSVENFSGDFTFVKSISSVGGDLLQRDSEIGITKNFAELWRAIVGQIGFGSVLVAVEVIDFAGPVERVPLRNRKSGLRGTNRGSEIFGKFLAAEFVGQFLPAIDGAGNGDRVDSLLRHVAQPLLVK